MNLGNRHIKNPFRGGKSLGEKSLLLVDTRSCIFSMLVWKYKDLFEFHHRNINGVSVDFYYLVLQS